MTYISLDDHIRTLGLSSWAINWLENAGIKTVGALISKSESELLEIRNFGRKSLDCVMAAISAVEKGEGDKCFSPYAASQYKRLRERANTRETLSTRQIFMGEDGNEYYDIPVADLGFSTRTYNLLIRHRIYFASKLIGITETACLRLEGVGAVSASEIVARASTLSFEPVPTRPVKVVRKAHMNLAREFKSSRIASIDDVLAAISRVDPASKHNSDKLLILLLDEPTLKDAVEHRIFHVIEQRRYGIPMGVIVKNIPVLNRCLPKTKEILKSMQEQRRIVRISTGGYIPKYMTLAEYINTIEDPKCRDLLLSRMRGEPYRVMGARYGITKTRAGQIVRTLLDDRRKPFLREDLYAPIFSKYMFSKEEFMAIFNEPEATFHYLTIVCFHARYYPQAQQAMKFESDEAIPEVFRKRAKVYLAKKKRLEDSYEE